MAGSLSWRDEEIVHPIEEVVARGAGHRPRPREGPPRLKDLLDDRIDAARLLGQGGEVALGSRSPSTWSMRRPSTAASRDQIEDQAVGLGETAGSSTRTPDQRLDVEKPAVVELLAGGAPERQPVVLAPQEPVEPIGVAVDVLDLRVDGGGNRGCPGTGGRGRPTSRTVRSMALAAAAGSPSAGRGAARRTRPPAPPSSEPTRPGGGRDRAARRACAAKRAARARDSARRTSPAATPMASSPASSTRP